MDMLIAKELTVSAALGDGSVPVIRDLNFSLPPGRILGLVGESGAGKSMIGRAIAQLFPPSFAVTHGELMFDGQDLVRMPAETRRELLGSEIAFVPQEPLSALNPVLTIGQQIDEHLTRLRSGNRRARHDRALAMLDAVHLSHGAELLSKYPHQLSGGMCQRVLIAMAFASRPKLLVADEPTTALDVTIQARIVELIAEMQQNARTSVVFITHDLRLAAQICDDILVLYAGRPAEYGPARRVFGDPAHPYTGADAGPERAQKYRGLSVRAALSAQGRRLRTRAAALHRGRKEPSRRLHPQRHNGRDLCSSRRAARRRGCGHTAADDRGLVQDIRDPSRAVCQKRLCRGEERELRAA